MKKLLIIAALVYVATGAKAQKFHAGLRLDGYDATMAGRYTRPTSSFTWGGSAWLETLLTDEAGVELSAGYAQRRGYLDLAPELIAPVATETNVVTLGAMGRFHLYEAEGGRLAMLAGLGAFAAIPLDKGWKVDVGPAIELGLEYGRVGVLVFTHFGQTDQLPGDAVDGRQRWNVVGMAVRLQAF